MLSGPLLVDTNVWISYFMGQGSRCPHITRLINACHRHGIDLLFAPSSLKDVFYIVPRELKRMGRAEHSAADERGEAGTRGLVAWACSESMHKLATPASMGLPECRMAHMLRGQHADLEDNLVLACAAGCKAEYVLTYDEGMIRDFPGDCITPEHACELLGVGA